ncbi:hypothetical protein DSM100688_1804 [Bifidobacterium ramosum]|uniref:Uncharacterized protein n=1 Tax=Bifidobacterium ramosum TaxID=1798158 RepID=A0A6L4WY88_9BIFI|nr:hypothetical protein [Bifidobacterium ramosum]KAB8287229.1 hypothetical protein DSM100688_1804 [Bifidobacterium ramosum]
MNNKDMLDQALRAPLASNDPSLGHYALSQAAWGLMKNLVRK